MEDGGASHEWRMVKSFHDRKKTTRQRRRQRSLMSRERGGDHLMSGRRGKQPFKIRREASQDRREVSGASHD